jgi:hypothetical protein
MNVEIVNLETNEILVFLETATAPRIDDYVVLDGEGYDVKKVLWLLTKSNRDKHPTGVISVHVYVKKHAGKWTLFELSVF